FPYAMEFGPKLPWFIAAQIRDVSHYADMGYDPSKFARPTQKDSRFTHYAKRSNSLMTIGWDGATEDVLNHDNDILELHCWMPRSKQKGLEDGRLVVIGGGNILQNGRNPYEHRSIPYVMFQSEKTPGKIWAKSAVGHILPLIREHQKSRSQIIEIKNTMSKPKWLVPKSANVKTTALTSEPGELIRFTGALPPTAWAPPTVPKYVFDLDVFNRKDMDDIMAQRDATKGTNPSGSRSATMLENLQAQDDGQLA
ncbi:unnamed protein product, partial [marine sediment metagenome]